MGLVTGEGERKYYGVNAPELIFFVLVIRTLTGFIRNQALERLSILSLV